MHKPVADDLKLSHLKRRKLIRKIYSGEKFGCFHFEFDCKLSENFQLGIN